MKHLNTYKKFNESSDPNIEIIRDAFYNITDEYPLDIKLDINMDSFHNIGGDVYRKMDFSKYMVYIEFKKSFCDANRNTDGTICKPGTYSDLFKKIYEKVLASQSYLKKDFRYISHIDINIGYGYPPTNQLSFTCYKR